MYLTSRCAPQSFWNWLKQDEYGTVLNEFIEPIKQLTWPDSSINVCDDIEIDRGFGLPLAVYESWDGLTTSEQVRFRALGP